MEPSRDQLLRVLAIAREHSRSRGGRGLSLPNLIREADSRSPRPRLGAPQLSAVLRATPGLIED